ncbi:hypothetical protein [Vibrio vulnificus]|uniref:hypothetical protein n=1 Tax=Vibrio vulnificus TaxID=672 RepID=UPI00102A6B2F|nr:hypothetical protein [Vibrio vulnificus]EGQ8022746.1 hypothetical protein [Vibrio vulnificus]RZQ71443.1 hypothetical protein D8T30_16490 [Vibrio vulnificus]RZQ95888.1 hypothetical protein D8T29_15165 [Vibrio vulnificus]RZR50285.1 hypothetical protein D8T35_12880 [Vibrio vulnificus]
MLTKKLERVVKHTISKIGKNGYTAELAHADFIFHSKKFEPEQLLALLSYPAYNKKLYSTFGLNQGPQSNRIFVSPKNIMPNSFNMKLFANFCNDNTNRLKEFVKLRLTFENALICGEYTKANLSLNKIDQYFGASLWSYDARLSVLTLSREDCQIDKLIKKSTELRIDHIANMLRKKHLSTTINTYLRQVLEKLLSEYRGNNQNEYIDFLSFLLVHREHDKERDIKNIISYIQQLGFLDRYVYYKMLISEYLSHTPYLEYDVDFIHFINEMEKIGIEEFWTRSKNIIDNNYKVENGNIDQESIIKFYSEGDYNKSLELCKSSLTSNPTNLTLLEIAAKSGHYLTSADKLEITDYANINNVETNSLLVRVLVRLCILFEQSSIYEPTLEEINTIAFKFRCIDRLNPLRTLIFTAYPYVNEDKVLCSSKEYYLHNETVTDKYYSILKNNDPFKGKVSDYITKEREEYKLSDSRALRLDIENSLYSSNLTGIKEKLSIMMEYYDITKPELYQLISSFYIKTKNLKDLIKILAEECVSQPDNIRLFPIRKIIHEIEKDEPDGEFRSSINSVVCCYIYMSIFDISTKEMVSEVFEDYLSYEGFITPSEKINVSKSISKVEKFFYEKICSKDIMSILLSIDNNKKLLIERLKIINTLSSKFEYQTESLLNEESELVNEILYNRVVDHHESNKISIDVDAISKSKFEDYRLFLLELCLLPDRDNYIHSHFNKFYPSVLEDFIFNKSYGLVRYLSSEIRHGVLPNQIRSVLEAYNIITELGDGDIYERNLYWRDYLSDIANEDFLNEIDSKLSIFSKECDTLISMANSWPNVSSDPNDQVSVFNYSYKKDTISRFKEAVVSEFDLARMFETSPTNNDVEKLIKICEEFIWKETEKHFLLMKTNLNHILKPKFSTLFSNFISSVSQCSNLVERCMTCRGKVIEEISLIETWFKRPTKDIGEKYNLSEIVLAAKRCFESIHSPKTIDIKIQGNYDKSQINLDSYQTLSLTRAIISMSQNALTHGIVNSSSPIIIDISIDDGVTLFVINEVSEQTKKSITKSRQVEKVNEFTLENNETKLISEGGTGLYKTYRFITDAFSKGSFKVKLEGSLFHQIARIE